MNYASTPSSGILYLVIGIIILIFVANDFLFRLFAAIFALSLINKGLKLQGLPTIHYFLQMIMNSLNF